MLLDIKSRLKDPDIASLLACCVYMPDEARLNDIADGYLNNENLVILGYDIDSNIIGCVGVDLTEHDTAVILHLAVRYASRGRGVGRKMITDLSQLYPGRRLAAETDDEAVGFYRSVGFKIEDIGEKYPGVRRYHCIWYNK